VDNHDRGHMRGIRGGNGRFEHGADTAAKDAKAVELRGRGHTYAEVAEALGMSHASSARKAVERALVATVAEPCAELRRLELLKLDQLSAVAWGVLGAEHPVVSDGKIMVHDGVALTDPMPTLHAIDRLLKISERRCRLLGLDAPIRVGGISMADIDAEIIKLDAELAARDDLAED